MFIIPISGYAVKGEANIFTPDPFLPSPTTVTQVTIQEILNQSVPTFTVKRSDGYKYIQIARDSLGGNYSGIWLGDLTTDNTNFALTGNGSSCVLNAPTGGTVKIGTNNDSCINVTGTVAATTGYLALTGKQQITGAKADEIQLKILGHASQSANVFQITASDGSTNRMSVAASGATTITGSADAAVQLKILASASQSASIFQVTGSNGTDNRFLVDKDGKITSANTLTVTTGGATITAGGLTVSAGGAGITGATTITGAASSDVIQLTVKGSNTQNTAKILAVQTSAAGALWSVSATGATTQAQSLTVSAGGYGVTGDSTLAGTLGITGYLSVTGVATAAAPQLLVVGSATQGAYHILSVARSDFTSLFSVDTDGSAYHAAGLTVNSGGYNVTGNSTVTGTLHVTSFATIDGVLKTGSTPVTLTNAAGNIIVSTLVASGTNGQVLTTVSGAVQWSSSVSSSGWNYTPGSPGVITTPSRVTIGQDTDFGAGVTLTVDDGAAGYLFCTGPIRIGPSPYFPSPAWHINVGSYNYQDVMYCAADQTYNPGLRFKMYRPYNVSGVVFTEHTWVAVNSAAADFTFLKIQYDVDDTTSGSEDSSIYYTVYQNGSSKVAYLTGAGVWTDASAAAGKVFVGTGKDVYGSVIEKLKGLYIGKYHAGDPKKEHHFSPTAEDFYKTFQLGIDPENDVKGSPGIAPKDLASLALAGLVELNEKVEALQQEIERLKKGKA